MKTLLSSSYFPWLSDRHALCFCTTKTVGPLSEENDWGISLYIQPLKSENLPNAPWKAIEVKTGLERNATKCRKPALGLPYKTKECHYTYSPISYKILEYFCFSVSFAILLQLYFFFYIAPFFLSLFTIYIFHLHNLLWLYKCASYFVFCKNFTTWNTKFSTVSRNTVLWNILLH